MKLRYIPILLVLLSSSCVVTSDHQSESAQIRIAALRFMMTKHAESGIDRQYYAFYVIRDFAYVGQFNGFRPTVVHDEEGRFSVASGAAIEVETGKRVKLWSVSDVSIREKKAEVGVVWVSGNLGAGAHTIFLEKKFGVWIAVSDRTDLLAGMRPNQSRQPTSIAVTFRADARPAPAMLVAAQ